MVGFSHSINNLKPSENIKQEELLADPDFPEYSIPLVNSSIPDFDFIDEWLKETDSMDTEVSLKNDEAADGGNPIEVKTELLGSMESPVDEETCKETNSMVTQVLLKNDEAANGGDPIEVKTELLGSMESPVVEETCRESIGIDSSITQVSLKNDEAANVGDPIEVKTELLGSIESPVVEETCRESIGIDSSFEMALEKVSLVGTSESSDILDINSEAVVTSGSRDCLLEKNLMVSEGGGNDVSMIDDPTESHNIVDEGDKEGSEIVEETCTESIIDSSIEIALEKVSLVGTSESSEILNINSEAVVTSGSRDCLLEMNLMVSEGGGNDVSMIDDPTKSHNIVDEGDKESSEIVEDTCRESIGIDSSIEMALEKVSLVGTSESSDILDINSESAVTSGSRDCMLEKSLMVSEGGGSDVSLVDDPTKSHNIVDEGDKESSEIVKDSKDGDDSSESESESEDEDEESENESSSSSDSSEEEEDEEMADVEEGEIKDLEELIGESDGDEEGFSVKGPIKSKNEVQDLPPVPKVDVTLEPHHQTLPVGVVLTIMDAKVIVEGVEMHNPLNEGSILWITENRSVLGLVDEIFGPVKNPYYVVRYNSKEEVPVGISEGTLISFVMEFADHILNDKNIYKKGYDASGENDEELTDEAEFSDDEKEAEYKRMQRMAKRGPSDDKKHGKRDFVEKKFQQKLRNVNNNQTSFPPSSVPPHQIHGGSGSSPSPFGTGMTNDFRPPFGPSTAQVPQAHSGPAPQQHPLRPNMRPASQHHPLPSNMGFAQQQHPLPSNMGFAQQQHPMPSNMGVAQQQHPMPSNMGVAQQQHPLPSNMGFAQQQPMPSNMGVAQQQHPLPSNMGFAQQQHPLPSNMGFAQQQHPMPSNMGVAQQQHPLPSNMGFAQQQHPMPSNMGVAQQQHPMPSNMGVAQQQHPLPSNMVWPNGQPYQQNVGFPNGFPMNAMPYVSYQQPQPFYEPQMFTGFSSGPPMPQHFNPSQRPISGPMPYGPSNIPPGMPAGMPVFMAQPGFNQGPIPVGFQGFPPRPHMNPGEQGVPPQGSVNETHMNVGEQDTQSQRQGPSNEQNNRVQPPSTQGNFSGNFSAQNRSNNRGAPRGRRPYGRGGGRGRH